MEKKSEKLVDTQKRAFLTEIKNETFRRFNISPIIRTRLYNHCYQILLWRYQNVHLEWEIKGTKKRRLLHVGFHTESKVNDINSLNFELLRPHLEKLEFELGKKASTNNGPDNGKLWFDFISDQFDLDDNTDEIKKFAVNTMGEMYKIIQPKIENLGINQ